MRASQLVSGRSQLAVVRADRISVTGRFLRLRVLGSTVTAAVPSKNVEAHRMRSGKA